MSNAEHPWKWKLSRTNQTSMADGVMMQAVEKTKRYYYIVRL